MLQVAQKDLEI